MLNVIQSQAGVADGAAESSSTKQKKGANEKNKAPTDETSYDVLLKDFNSNYADSIESNTGFRVGSYIGFADSL